MRGLCVHTDHSEKKKSLREAFKPEVKYTCTVATSWANLCSLRPTAPLHLGNTATHTTSLPRVQLSRGLLPKVLTLSVVQKHQHMRSGDDAQRHQLSRRLITLLTTELRKFSLLTN